MFVKAGNISIPLGIHVGIPESISNYSVFLSLETFRYEAKKKGWTLQCTELRFGLPACSDQIYTSFAIRSPFFVLVHALCAYYIFFFPSLFLPHPFLSRFLIYFLLLFYIFGNLNPLPFPSFSLPGCDRHNRPCLRGEGGESGGNGGALSRIPPKTKSN